MRSDDEVLDSARLIAARGKPEREIARTTLNHKSL